MDRARAELEGRTGETDSKIEMNEEVFQPEPKGAPGSKKSMQGRFFC